MHIEIGNTEKFMLSYELGLMSKYLELMESALQDRFQSVDALYDEVMATDLPEDEAAFLDNQLTDELIEAGKEFPRLLLLSFITTWYSLVEQRLLDFCERRQLNITVGIRDKDGLGKGIWRAHTFLLKGLGYKIDPDLWQELVEINKLRNVIVHEGNLFIGTYTKPAGDSISYINDGDLTLYIRMNDKLFQYLQKHGMVEYSSSHVEIVPTFEYCRYLIELSRKLFFGLYADLKLNSRYKHRSSK